LEIAFSNVLKGVGMTNKAGLPFGQLQAARKVNRVCEREGALGCRVKVMDDLNQAQSRMPNKL
jgi:hypothetical protein